MLNIDNNVDDFWILGHLPLIERKIENFLLFSLTIYVQYSNNIIYIGTTVLKLLFLGFTMFISLE